jgi:hypothetical protein
MPTAGLNESAPAYGVAPVATQGQPDAPRDWGTLRALFVKGMTLKEISDQFNIAYSTVKARSAREKWATTVARADDAIVQTVTKGLADSASRFIGRIDSAVHASLDNLERKGMNKLGLRDLQIALDCMDKANRIARSNYGLDKQGAASASVSIHLTANAKPHLTGSIIDVEQLAGDGQPSGDLAQKQLGGGAAAE